MSAHATIEALFSWNGSAPRPVMLRIEHAPEAKCADDRSFPSSHHMPAFGSALIVPRPPDYSTPSAITSRCREAGTHADADLVAAMRSTEVKRAYRDFRKATPALACPAGDTHRSRWRIVRDNEGALVLVDASAA